MLTVHSCLLCIRSSNFITASTPGMNAGQLGLGSSQDISIILVGIVFYIIRITPLNVRSFKSQKRQNPSTPSTFYIVYSCRTATLDFFSDLAESKVAVFLCSILTSDGVPFCFGKNSFP